VGNARDASSLPVLRPVIENGTQTARGRAIRALRFIVDPTVPPLLASLLQNKICRGTTWSTCCARWLSVLLTPARGLGHPERPGQ
jgi:hypothetical protein